MNLLKVNKNGVDCFRICTRKDIITVAKAQQLLKDQLGVFVNWDHIEIFEHNELVYIDLPITVKEGNDIGRLLNTLCDAEIQAGN